MSGDIAMIWNRTEALDMTSAVRTKPTQLYRLCLCIAPTCPMRPFPVSLADPHVFVLSDLTTILRSGSKDRQICRIVADERRAHSKHQGETRMVDHTESGATLTFIVHAMLRWRAAKPIVPGTDPDFLAVGRTRRMLPGEHSCRVLVQKQAHRRDSHETAASH